jgi:ZIP family zinc transporter
MQLTRMKNTEAMSKALFAAWAAQARANPNVVYGLTGATIVIVLLIAASSYNAFTGENHANVGYAFLGGMTGFGATALGALLAFSLRGVTTRMQDVMLGFAAGMMLAASSFSLILPGLDAAAVIVGPGPAAAFIVVVGLALGVVLMLSLDRFTPHEHQQSGLRGPQGIRLSRVWLFVLAITLHNLPEGMAIGVGFAHGDMSVGLPLTAAIAIQDIPEGLAVALALRAVGLPALRAVLVAIATGIMEPLGAMVGIGMSSGFALAYPVSMGFAAGAMIFVVSHEVIPETHRNGHETFATVGLMAGFGVMMFLDTAFG